jgi:hypothetical protein
MRAPLCFHATALLVCAQTWNRHRDLRRQLDGQHML